MHTRTTIVLVALGAAVAAAIGIPALLGSDSTRANETVRSVADPAAGANHTRAPHDSNGVAPVSANRARTTAVSSDATTPEVESTIDLEVVRADTRVPLSGASVWCWPKQDAFEQPEEFEVWLRSSSLEAHCDRALESKTDDRGHALAHPSEFGQFIAASAGNLFGYASVDADTTGTLRIALSPTIDITVDVVTPSGTPVPNVPVALRKQIGPREVDVLTARTTALDGRAMLRHANLFADPKAESFFVAVAGLFDPPLRREVRLDGLSESVVQFVLEPTGSCAIAVVDENGESLGGAFEARLQFADAEPLDPAGHAKSGATLISRAGEDAVFEHVALGRTLEVHVAHAGSDLIEVATGPGPKEANERVQLQVRVDPHATIFRGRVLDVNGAALADASVRVRVEGQESGSHQDAMWSLRTDAEGRFSLITKTPLENQTELSLVVERLSGRGVAVASARRTLPSTPSTGSIELGDFRLSELQVVVAGDVVDQKGAPVSGAIVVPSFDPDVMSEASEPRRSTRRLEPVISDGRGRFEIRAQLARIEPSSSRLRLDATQGSRVCEPMFVSIGERAVRLVLVESMTITGTVLVDPTLSSSMILVRATREERSELGNLAIAAPCVVAPNGRFELHGLLPGMHAIHVDDAATSIELAVVPGVSIEASATKTDPRLDPLDLRARWSLVALELVDERGDAVHDARGYSRPIGNAEEKWSFASRTDNSVHVLCDGRPLEVSISAPGFRRTVLEHVDASRRVVLQRAAQLRLKLAPGLRVQDEPLRLGLELTPLDGGHSSPFTNSGVLTFDERGEILCTTPFIGDLHFELSLASGVGSSSSFTYVDESARNVIHVTERDGEQTFEIHCDPARLEAAVRAVRGDH